MPANNLKYTEQVISKIFYQAEKMIDSGEKDFRKIEKTFVKNAKGFGYLVGRFPQFRNDMYRLMVKCDTI